MKKFLLFLLVPALAALGHAATAVAQANLEISTPAISTVRESMRQRFNELRPYFESGAIGFTRDGNVALRDANLVPLPQRQQANSLIAAENADRAALYREVARANSHPEWEQDIRNTFGQRWVERAPAGWYYQTAAGTWARK